MANNRADREEKAFNRRGFLIAGGLASTGMLSAGCTLTGDASSPSELPVVEVASGRLMGERTLGGAFAFKGVPYGADTRQRRFQPPLPVPEWRGVRDATRMGPVSPQSGAGVLGVDIISSWHSPDEVQSEDCLRVNVWTNGLRDNARRPVMVWLHGGGFHSGSGNSPGYDGTRLAERQGVVVVSVTHRLNAFGHLYLKEIGGPELADSGNVGVLDIVLCLQWIQENIEAFGGDAENVTIFGESGGGGKVAALMSMPLAKGLFHRAVIQSASTGIGGRSAEYATQDALAYIDELGLRPDQLDLLKTAPVALLREGLLKLKQRTLNGEQPWLGFSQREWRPVIDGRSFPDSAFYPEAPAISADIPLLIGTAKDEVRLHLGSLRPHTFDLEWEDLAPTLESIMSMDPTSYIDFYRREFPSATASELLFKIFTYWRWRHSAIWVAEKRLEANQGPTYMYRVDWETAVDGGKWRALHMIDIPFVFDNVALSSSILGDTPNAQAMADEMSARWATFARTGNPNPTGAVEWPEYDLENRATMRFHNEIEVLQDPEQLEREFFVGTLPRMSL
ncbi:MAG: carboxylesterase family protein [Hyphomonadaceae bacterium]|nr:carboxylesterase family protein [Hyphomonadaceae bacterium]